MESVLFLMELTKIRILLTICVVLVAVALLISAAVTAYTLIHYGLDDVERESRSDSTEKQ